MVRITTVVSPQNSPASTPSKSPRSVAPCSARKPSRSAKSTAAKAASKPSHWRPRRRSAPTHSGTSSATQKGEVYKNTVSREAEVYCMPV